MSQNLFVENEKRSRRKALLMTIMFHVLIILGVVLSSPSGLSDLQDQIEELINPTPEEEIVSMI